MPSWTVLPFGAVVALLGLLLPPWLTLGALGATALVLVFSLRLQRAIRFRGAAAPSAVVSYLCGCLLLLPATGVHVAPGVSVGQVAALGTLGAFLTRRTDRRHPATGRAFALTSAVMFLLGSSIAAYWNATSDSIPFVAELLLVVLPIVLSMRHFGPTRDEAMTLMKAWLVGVMLSAAAGLTFATSPSGRSVGAADHPNQFGMQTAMAIPVVWGLYENRRLNRRQLLVAVVLLWAAVLASGARSGLIAATIGTLLVMLRALGGPATIVMTVLLGGLGWFMVTGAAAGLAGFGALGRLLGRSSTAASDTGRLELMREGLSRVSSWDTALLGAGWLPHHQPHNLLILAWVSAGVIGVLALAILMTPPLVRALDLRSDSFEWSLAVSAVTFLAAVFLNNALAAPFAWVVFSLMEFRWSRSGTRLPSHVQHDPDGPGTHGSQPLHRV